MLPARASAYFKSSVSARLKFTPAPSTAEEVSFIRDCFSKIATIEYFSVQNALHTSGKLYEQPVSVCLSPIQRYSQLDPFTPTDHTQYTSYEATQRQFLLNQLLHKLIGLPRYSYVANDSNYFNDTSQVPFKHALSPKARITSDLYELSTSTISNPFVIVKRGDNKTVAANIRHNFQKYHKIETIFIENGLSGISALTKSPNNLDVALPDRRPITTLELMDLSQDPGIQVTRNDAKGFQGFLTSNFQNK